MPANSRKNTYFWLIFLPDLLLLYASLFLAIRIRYPSGLPEAELSKHLTAFSVIHLLWLLVLFIHGLFEVGAFRRYSTLIFNLISASVVNVLLATTYFYFQPNLILTPRRFLLLHAGIAFAFLLLWHLVLKYAFKNRLAVGVYLLSVGNQNGDLDRQIEAHPYLGFRSLGYLTEDDLVQKPLAKNSGIVVPDDLHARPDVLKKLYQLRTSGVSFYGYRELYEQLLRRVHLSELDEGWFLENVDYRTLRFYNLVKRAVDLLAGSLGLLVFLASYPLVGLLIKLTSKGPVLFVQERVGQGGSVFKVYKYRTMSGGRTDTWTEKNDPRITPVGGFLRKSRLDELPQSINLLLGNMSLVGPRPEQVHIVERLRAEVPFYDERHLVKPGLTGWAQLNVYASSVEETRLKLQYDLYYIKHRGFWFDLEIILKTVYYVFTWRGR